VGSLLIGGLASLTSAPAALATLSIASLVTGLWIRQRYPELRAAR